MTTRAPGPPPGPADAPSFGGFSRARSLRPREKALPEYARNHNRALVLQTLFHGGRLSRADLSRLTGLTRVTISDLVADLIAEGLVAERGQREGVRPGKPAVLLELDASAFQLVGIDLSGADRFRGAVLRLDGTIEELHEVALGTAFGESALDLVLQLLDRLVRASGASVLGVGVASPGIVDGAGRVLSAPNLGWSGTPLQERLASHSGLAVHVANDANAAALAEHSFGGAVSDFMLVRVGSGVGAGLLIDGTPLSGRRFAAGEIGHVVVGTDGGAECACGKRGCLETWLAIPRLREALARAEPGDAASASAGRFGVLRDAGERLGIALAPVVAALNLAEIVLSGPVDLLAGPLADAALTTLRARTLPALHDDLSLRVSQQPDEMVLRGAAVLVLSAELGVS